MRADRARLPYPGLRSFDREEADLFFGRDGAVDDMIDRLAATRFLAVLGASGSGKSSLVKTGLLDGLELGLHPAGSDWVFCAFTPGGHPFHQLALALQAVQAEALATEPGTGNLAILEGFLRRGPRSLVEWAGDGYLRPGSNLLLLVDQFEELFRYGGYAEREEAEGFVKLLIESASSPAVPIHVVITMRSDFLGACALIPGLAEIINAGAYLTPRMGRNDCRAAIVGPARMVGMEIEERLVNRLLNDLIRFAPWEGGEESDQLKRLSRRADQLPVMQHLLNRLWQQAIQRPGSEPIRLTEQEYEAVGGLDGALDAHGAEILSRFGDHDRPLVRTICCALVDGNAPASATRRPLQLSDLVAATDATESDVRRIVDVFRAPECSFFRPGPEQALESGTVVDISHESLIRKWSTLSQWVIDEARAAALWRRVAAAAARYHDKEGGLLTGLDLANVLAWWQEKQPTENWARRYSDDFAGVLAYLQESEEAESLRRAEHDERTRRDRRRLVIGLVSVSALAIATSVFALWGVSAERRAASANENAVAVAQDLTNGLFDRIDDGLSMPISTRFALIQDREVAIGEVAKSLSSARRVVDMQADLLLRSIKTLLDAGWSHEAFERAEHLAELMRSDHSQSGRLSDPEFRLEALLAIARSQRFHGNLPGARATFASAAKAFSSVRANRIRTLRLQSELDYLDFELAGEVRRFDEQLVQQAALADSFKQLATLIGWNADTERFIDTDSRASIAVGNAQDASTIVENFIRAQLEAINTIHSELRSEALQAVSLEKLTSEVRRAYALFEEIGAPGIPKRELQSIYKRETAEYLSDSAKDVEQAFKLINDAVSLAASLCAEDPKNLSFRNLLALALVQRSRIAAQKSEFDLALKDLDAVRSIALDTKRLVKPLPDWKRLDQTISYYTYDTARLSKKPDLGKRAASRMKAEVDFATKQGTQHRAWLERSHAPLIWALLDPNLELPISKKAIAEYAAGLLDTAKADDESQGHDFAQRRLRSFSYDRLLMLPPAEVGDATWKQFFQDAQANSAFSDPKARNELIPLSIFGSLPMVYAQRITPDEALSVRKAQTALDALDPSKDVAQALELASSTLTTVPLAGATGDDLYARIKLRQSVFDRLAKFATDDPDRNAWLRLVDVAIAEAQQLESGSTTGLDKRREFYLGRHAQAYVSAGAWAQGRDEFAEALSVALADFVANPASTTPLSNATIYGRQWLSAALKAGEFPSIIEPLDRMIRKILADQAFGSQVRGISDYVKSLKTQIEQTITAIDSENGAALTSLRELQVIASRIVAEPTRAAISTDAVPTLPDFTRLHESGNRRRIDRVNWTFAPIYSGTWRTLQGAERQALLDRLLDPSELMHAFYVRSTPLPFYAEGKLVEIELQTAAGVFGVRSTLVFPGKTYVLNGTSPPIHQANKNAPIKLGDLDDVSAYLRFFTSYVNGDYGAFQLVDSVDEIIWQDSADRKTIARTAADIRPLAVWQADGDRDNFFATGTVQYGNAVFSAKFKISRSGMIEMLGDRPIAGDLPVKPIIVSERRVGHSVRTTAEQVDLSLLGIKEIDSFKNELAAVLETYDGARAEDRSDLIDEYLSYLEDEVFSGSLDKPEELLNSFAYSLLKRGLRPERATELARRAHAAAPSEPHIMDTYGWGLIQTGHIKDGIQVLNEARNTFDAKQATKRMYLELYAHLGHAYRLDGQIDAALETFAKAQALDLDGEWMDFVKTELDLLKSERPDAGPTTSQSPAVTG